MKTIISGFGGIVLIGAIGTFLIVGCADGKGAQTFQSPPGSTATYILVRHAEKANSSPESPLNSAGRKRALSLVDTLVPMGVTAIYCPELIRNKETVQPLAGRLGLEVHTISGWQLLNTRRFAEKFVQETLSKHTNGVILWAGNSSAVNNWGSNLQELYIVLGGEGQGPHAYDDLFVIIIDDNGLVDIQKRHYGASVP